MKILLDTHAMIWISTNHVKLTQRVKELFLSTDNEIHFSMASVWEMAIKISLGKLSLPISLAQFVSREVRGNAIKQLNIRSSHLYGLAGLPFHHRDPFDRLIISQAQYEGLTVATRDPMFAQYDVETIW